jgi:hypothetical protein
VEDMNWDWLIGVPYVGGALVVLTGVMAFIRKVLPVIRRIGHFVDDWFGEPGRLGTAAVPGVLARLTAIESRLSRVEGQFKPNSGSTLRDAVDRVEEQVQQLNEGGKP